MRGRELGLFVSHRLEAVAGVAAPETHPYYRFQIDELINEYEVSLVLDTRKARNLDLQETLTLNLSSRDGALNVHHRSSCHRVETTVEVCQTEILLS